MPIHVRPRAISLALWLNAWRVGNLTLHDSINACETITDTNEVIKHGEAITWQALIESLGVDDEPFTVALPQSGDPQGLPPEVLKTMDLPTGAVALSRNDLLVQSHQGHWMVVRAPHAVAHIGIAHARSEFNTHIEQASQFLTSAELAGDRSQIDAALQAHVPAHVPPQLPAKLSQALSNAERVRLVAYLAHQQSIAFASPSTNAKKEIVLRELDRTSRDVMIAVAGHSFTM